MKAASPRMVPALTPLREVPAAVKHELGLPKDCDVYFKDETGSVGGSKARVARSLLDEGERTGQIATTTEVQLPSSGSTALAMAEETGRRGMTLQVFLPATTAPAKMAALERYRHVRLVRVAGSSEDAREAAEEYVRSSQNRHRVWLADQYGDHAAVLAHQMTTAPELRRQTAGRLTHVVAGIGTASTTTGLALALGPLGVEVIGVQPTAARHALTGLKYFPALPEYLIPRNAQLHRLSAVEYVADDEALAMTRLLIQRGFFFGPSTGAVVCAAARRFSHLQRRACVVLLAHDPAHYYPELLPEVQHA
ncbi:MAG TPA: pyridoxal-phosphate dependent enzyme [Thermoanaerobaculia bacterium]